MSSGTTTTENFPAVLASLYELGDVKGGGKGADRAALAALRRGIADEQGFLHSMRYVAKFARFDADLDRLVLLAGLFALWPEAGKASIGEALRQVRQATKSDSIELRVQSLLQASSEDLATHLRHAVTLCRSRDARIDWRSVYRLIWYWNDEHNRQQRTLARDFWGTTEVAQPGTDSATR